ncbi:DinB family protein [Xanthovirga aplysinae]|uniref:DinB family protein n=1 Tax=Xanthovirga aplysinae TaxID=2529853 RepID=UPI0012BD53CB|nr:DinB family protein [Xanthovirga aplysinae]MTI31067.1 DinB family protein [Xanthovirga aplysinae]
MENEVRQLILKLRNIFEGNPWYGESVIQKLDALDLGVVNEPPITGCNSIGRLVQHVINWRIFAIKKLEGDKEFDIPLNGPMDWPDIHIGTIKGWEKMMQNLNETQTKIIDLLSDRTSSFLKGQVPGREYDFQFLIEGIIQHDIYHLGQIRLINLLINHDDQNL